MDPNQLDFTDVHALVLGDVMLDTYIHGDVHRISPEAPVPVVQVKERQYTLGGAGNVALNLQKLGCSVSLFGVRGDDLSGHQVESFLYSHHIRDMLMVESEHPTTTKTRIIGNGQQQLLRFDEEQPWECPPDEYGRLYRQVKDLISFANVVVLSDYNKGFLSSVFVEDVISWARNCGKRIVADPPYGSSWDAYKCATILTPNLLELETISNRTLKDRGQLVDVMCETVSEYELDVVVTTLGKEGIAFYEEDEDGNGSFDTISSEAKEVYDVSGAGDTVLAVLAACIGNHEPYSRAVMIANKAAGIVVGKQGTQPILINELREALREN